MKLLTAVKFILIFFLFSRMSCEDNIPEPTFTIGTESDFQINQLYYSIDGNISLKIMDAKPYPKISVETKPEDLVVTLLIQMVWHSGILLQNVQEDDWIQSSACCFVQPKTYIISMASP